MQHDQQPSWDKLFISLPLELAVHDASLDRFSHHVVYIVSKLTQGDALLQVWRLVIKICQSAPQEPIQASVLRWRQSSGTWSATGKTWIVPMPKVLPKPSPLPMQRYLFILPVVCFWGEQHKLYLCGLSLRPVWAFTLQFTCWRENLGFRNTPMQGGHDDDEELQAQKKVASVIERWESRSISADALQHMRERASASSGHRGPSADGSATDDALVLQVPPAARSQRQT